ncbi:hypothetical protein K2173_019428 [Erythroxylum novogranatense]|uniref:Kinesin motor domain-containing protein n=1 Tax=Erythroxylum novogranatense TaxID=1862640 RepID=A0AAV8UBB5_9ROSI|nr:hypothetical protein K2173_019428 [Erythroxylum novogranatense]
MIRAFGPATQQNELFDSAISPIVNEVLEGYNCTIFAFGQTGTGKTYTMEGGKVSKVMKMENSLVTQGSFQEPSSRYLKFNALKATNADYRLKITFLELYNEEITDRLTPDEHVSLFDDKSKKPIALMEDGKGNVFIRGLEQEVVHTANEGRAKEAGEINKSLLTLGRVINALADRSGHVLYG